MPWSIRKRNNQFCVVQQGGAVVACHATAGAARLHQKALYANEPQAGRAGRRTKEKIPIKGKLCHINGHFANCEDTAAQEADTQRTSLRDKLRQQAEEAKLAKQAERDAKKKPPKGKAPTKPKAPAKAPKGAAAKPKKTPAERDQEVEDRRRARMTRNRTKISGALATELAPEASDALYGFADGEELDAEMAQLFDQMGLLDTATGGEQRLSTAGKAFVHASNRGDVRAAKDALSKGRDKRAAEAAAEQERQDQEAARAAEQAKRDADKAAREAKRNADRAQRLAEREQRRQAAEQRRASRTRTRGKASGMAVYKDARGRYRWITFSSNGYRDRDHEIVSTKALQDDCSRADADGQYGPLRWWHMPGVDLGDCDFNAMEGRVLVESGTFRNERIGARMKEAADQLQVSIGFLHPKDEPDADGTFHHIRRFERSLTPRGKAANPYTQLVIKENMMDAEKAKQLAALLQDPDLVNAVLSQAQATQKTAQEAGVAYKAVAPVVVPVAETKAPAAVAAGDMYVEPAATDAAAGDAGDDEADVTYVGDMPIEDFLAALDQRLAPVMDALGASTKIAEQATAMQALAESLGRTKEADSAAQTAQASKITALESAFKEAKDQQSKIERDLAELRGDAPRNVQGYRASQDAGTTDQGAALKAQMPHADPHTRGMNSLAGFIEGFVMPGTPPGQ